MQKDLTQGNVLKNLLIFSVPFLISSFLQTFYGLADLFIAGQFNGAEVISAVSIGSQVTHMLTVIIVGLAMGTTVTISRAVGAKQDKEIARGIGNTILLFLCFAAVATVLLCLSVNGILGLISTPPEAVEEARKYLLICFLGVPFITAYNVISSMFRGMGDSRTPMYFVAVAGIFNIVLDYILIGPLRMGAAGAALATVTAQALSVIFALTALMKKDMGIAFSWKDIRFEGDMVSRILKIGVPIAVQDGFIQISFLVITAIANSRGVTVAASVGIVEKVICFVFLVPSAMMSAVSAIAAQNAGAGMHEQGKEVLKYGTMVGVIFGAVVAGICQFGAEGIVSLFVNGDTEVVRLGGQYLRSYIFDCMFASIHFCFSGYFCAYGKAYISFLHNVISVLLVRIPGTYLASVYFPDTLYPMGWAAPMGSLLSALICIGVFMWLWSEKNRRKVFV